MPILSPGVGLMLAAAVCFSTGTLFIKLAGMGLPPMEILFTRSLIGFFYCFFLLRGTGHSIFGTKRLYLALRGLLGFGALFCMFSAFILLPLADATVIFFAHPIFVAIGGIPAQGNPRNPRRVLHWRGSGRRGAGGAAFIHIS
jgi:drug/metabolite transporter (DMT)-like permease